MFGGHRDPLLRTEKQKIKAVLRQSVQLVSTCTFSKGGVASALTSRCFVCFWQYNAHTQQVVSLSIFSINYRQQPAEIHNIQPVTSQSTHPPLLWPAALPTDCLKPNTSVCRHSCPLLLPVSAVPGCFRSLPPSSSSSALARVSL